VVGRENSPLVVIVQRSMIRDLLGGGGGGGGDGGR
jgi:hypothetical protein